MLRRPTSHSSSGADRDACPNGGWASSVQVPPVTVEGGIAHEMPLGPDRGSKAWSGDLPGLTRRGHRVGEALSRGVVVCGVPHVRPVADGGVAEVVHAATISQSEGRVARIKLLPSVAGLRAGPMQDVSRREQVTGSEGGIDLLIERVEFHSPATKIAGEIHDICTSVGSLHPGIG